MNKLHVLMREIGKGGSLLVPTHLVHSSVPLEND